MTTFDPNRRHLLRGAGAAICLPWLETLAPRRQPAPPPRLCVVVMPNGVLPEAWDPAPDGHGGWQPSFALAGLGDLAGEVTVCRHLANRQSFDGDGHYAKVAPLLTGRKIRRTGGRELWNGVSMDQIAARTLGRLTPVPSLELACDPIYPVEDMGYSTLYGGHIAWAAPDQPLARELVPRRAFDRLFRSSAMQHDPARQSVLDLVRDDAARLRRTLSRADQGRLDDFAAAIRALELRIAAAEQRPDGATVATAEFARGIPADYPDHVGLLFDVVELAFASDATRVVTFLMANEVSGRNFAFVDGCAGGFHEFSHHEGRADKQEPYRRINRWHVEQFRGLLERLARHRVGDDRLLDHSAVVLASAMKDGNAHSPHDLPILLAGGRGLGLPQGRLLTSRRDTPLCRLWLALLQRLGAPVDSFGDADRPLF